MRKFEQEARDMAAADYDKLAAENRPFSAVPGNTFLGSYPTKSGYVEEWWEERYLPVVKRNNTNVLSAITDAMVAATCKKIFGGDKWSTAQRQTVFSFLALQATAPLFMEQRAQATDDMVVLACKTFFGPSWDFVEVEMMRDALNAALTLLPVTGTATAYFPELPPVQPKLIVEFKDGDGKTTERYEVETENVTQEEIDDAVGLIEGGCDARTAMMLAKQGRPA